MQITIRADTGIHEADMNMKAYSPVPSDVAIFAPATRSDGVFVGRKVHSSRAL